MAKRDKLTHRQKRQVARKQREKLGNQTNIDELGDLSEPRQGLLVSRYGEQADIFDLQEKSKYRCYLRQNLGAPVTGDRVMFRVDQNRQGVVEVIHPRESLLERPAQHQGLKPVVANIDLVFVVIAPLPDFSATLLDRYLVALQNAGISVQIIANKWDLELEVERQQIESHLKPYHNLHYPIIHFSAKSGLGLQRLISIMDGKRSILVGQSGVGKSSIINQLFPHQESLVNKVSENSRLGQHTTTASQLFMFEQSNGFIIDSPGIREFGLWHMDSQTVANGFIEFEAYIGTCKFRDCKHLNEPGCEIIAAVNANKISPQRWQSYCKIINTTTP